MSVVFVTLYLLGILFSTHQIRLRGSATLGAPKNQYVYQEVKELQIVWKNIKDYWSSKVLLSYFLTDLLSNFFHILSNEPSFFPSHSLAYQFMFLN